MKDMSLHKISKRNLRNPELAGCVCSSPGRIYKGEDRDPYGNVTEVLIEQDHGRLFMHVCDEASPEPSTEDIDAASEVLRRVFGGGGIDTDQVRDIVRAEVDAIVYPTKTVVVRDHETADIEGTTHVVLSKVIMAAMVDHVMTVGPAGTGKSTIARQTAEGLALEYFSMSMGPQTSQTAFLGFVDGHGNYHDTVARRAFESGGLLCLDELDNANAAVLTMLNAMLSGDPVAFPDGKAIRAHNDFRVIGTANTYGLGATREYVGRQALDKAFLDRFTIIDVDVDEGMETTLARAQGAPADVTDRVLETVRAVRKNAAKHGIKTVVSPRASIKACALVSAGFSFDEAIDARVRRGMDSTTWNKLVPA